MSQSPNWITSPLIDWREYFEFCGISINTPFCKNEVTGNIYWTKIFKFKQKNIINCNINLCTMNNETCTNVLDNAEKRKHLM